MSHSLLSVKPTAEIGKTFQAKWTPPEQLLELASDDEGLIADMIDLFKTAAETCLQHLRTALAAVDIQRLHAEAHFLRGSALQLGGDALAEVCQRLEGASSLTPAPQLAELVDRLQERFDEISGAMASYAKSNQAVVLEPPRLRGRQ